MLLHASGYRIGVTSLDLAGDVVDLTAALVDVPSESRHERALADAVQAALEVFPHLTVQRLGNTVIARTDLGLPQRVLIGGHLDTVPSAGNLPHHIEGDLLFGLGSCDMKGGIAVALHLAAKVRQSNRDVTYVFYECEEVDASANGLQRIVDEHRDWLETDLAILMEPTRARIEAGCQGTLRAQVRVAGRRAHSARSWMGDNAVHGARRVLEALEAYEPRQPIIDGLQYREGLNAVAIRGGIAGNVIPDECIVTVNYRFAPDRSVDDAGRFIQEFFAEYEVDIVDAAPGAMPGMGLALAQSFSAAVGGEAEAKLGWTDVARFRALGTPALNFGPGDPALAHAPNEHVATEQIYRCAQVMRDWLTA
jgi:succinyl-diaminopimelate desuccinylase